MRKLLLVFIVCLASFHQAYAEDEFGEDDDEFGDFYGSEEFVSIATGSKKSISKVPAIASVITSQQIQNMGATDLDEILETVPGLHVTRRSSSNSPIYVFRGVFTRFNPQVLMLINGIPVTNIFVGNRGQTWGGMPVDGISRIEIIRGPGSAIYGADAFSGIINIITKGSGELEGTEIGARVGSFNTKDAWFSTTGQFEGVSASAIYEYRKTDGHNELILEDAQTRLDGIFGTSASLAPGPMVNFREQHDLRIEVKSDNIVFRAGLQEREVGTGAGIVEALSPSTIGASTRVNADISYQVPNLREDTGLQLQASYFSSTQEYKSDLILFPAGADIGFGAPFPDGVIGNPEVFERHYKSSAVYSYDVFQSHDFRIGAGYNFSEVYKVQESKNFALGPNGDFLTPGSPVVDVSDTPFVFLPERSRESYFFYAQDIWQLSNDWEITAGVRHDDYNDFGSTTNPRVALVWANSLNSTMKLLHGRAFRAPSFANLFNINNPAALGNPNLSPEKIATTELAWDYRVVSEVQAVISLFHYEWKDIILFVPDESLTATVAKNTGQNVGYGLEFEFKWTATEKFNISGNYSIQNSKNDQTDERVAQVPEWQIYLAADYDLTDFIHLNININHVANRSRSSSDLRSKIDDFSLVNLTLNWHSPNDKWKAGFSVRNLFDEDAREPTPNNGAAVNIPHDLPLPGRNIYGEIAYKF